VIAGDRKKYFTAVQQEPGPIGVIGPAALTSTFRTYVKAQLLALLN